MAISTPMLVTFIVYIFGMVLIGFIAWRSTKNFDDYILGGRSLGPFVTALSAGASDMSGWLLMGLPGLAYFTGAADPMWTAMGDFPLRDFRKLDRHWLNAGGVD